MKDEVSPIEIVKGTPKSNCGECGYSTCIAFATNVTRRLEHYSKCPYIQLDKKIVDKLEYSFVNIKEKREPGVNAITGLEEKIKSLDLVDVAKKLGLTYFIDYNKTILYIDYFDERVKFTNLAGVLTLEKISGEPVDLYDKILIYNYIFFSGSSGISGTWVSMEGLPNSISKVKALEKGSAKPFRDFFSGKVDLLKERVKKFDHKILKNGDCISDFCVVINIFKMLPVRINFYDKVAEDNLGAEVKFLYDKNVLSYLDLESIVFATEKLTEKLTFEDSNE